MTFPTHIPTDTVLDCILDENWQSNGLLHVLDVIRWRSQDYTHCEASFRYVTHKLHGNGAKLLFRFWWRDMKLAELAKAQPPPSSSQRPPQFAYPHTLQPIPHFSDLRDISILQNTIIPLARSGIPVNVPLAPSNVPDDCCLVNHCQSDGILFYVAESSYEAGPSLLAAWVPSMPLNPGEEPPLEVFANQVDAIVTAL